MKKIFAFVGILICIFGTTACSKNIESESKSVIGEVTETVKPTGNLRMQDEKGNIRITIEDIGSVEIVVNENESRKDYGVSLNFTDEGGEKFENVTKELIGQSLEIYVDDELIIKPIIQSIITDGKVQISNFESYEEADKLVNLIQGNNEKEKISVPLVKITENDGTILVTEKEIENYYVELRSIGKGGSSVTVIVIEFTDEGKEIMKEKTAKLVGQEINLVINGELLYDTELDKPIEDGEFLLLGFDTEEKRYEITNKLNHVLK